MKKSFIITFTVIISLIYIFALSYFGINVYNTYKNGKNSADSRFEKMALNVKKIPSTVDFNSQDFLIRIQNAIDDANNYATLEITIDGKSYYKYPSDDKDVVADSKLILYKTRTFDLEKATVTITANVYTLRPADIFYYGKFSFLLILAATVLTLIVILYDRYVLDNAEQIKNEELKPSLTKKSAEKDNSLEAEVNEALGLDADSFIEDTEKTVEPALENETAENTVSIEENTELSQEPVFDNTPAADDNIEIEADSIPEESNVFEDAFNFSTEEEIKETEQLIADDEELIKFSDSSDTDSDEKEPVSEGLFSPVTGFGWESYLSSRLNNELNRASASESDLSLFEIKVEGVPRESELSKKVCKYLADAFQFKDLIFEYKDDSYVAIKVNMDVDEALDFAEKIIVNVDNILKSEGKCYIGISSRTIRLIGAERLLKEADEAVLHAKEDPESPIIAFRADADKYRKFIEEN